MNLKFCLSLFLSGVAYCSLQAQHRTGIFDNSTDIGNPKIAGSASYDESTQAYSIKGGGSNIWFNRDEFHFLYKKIKGDFILTADFAFTGDTAGAVGHRKTGWMIRESTEEGAASANACKHIDGLVVLQWRPYHGMFMRDPEEEKFYKKKGGQTIQLSRIGKTITMKIAHPGEPLQEVGSCETETLNGEVLAGIYICSHDSNSAASAKIWNVRIDKPVIHEYHGNPHVTEPPVTDILGSRLEIIDVADGNRKVIHEAPGRFEATNWMPDGKKLLFNEGGSLYTIPIEGGTPEKLNTGAADKINNTSARADGSEYSPDKKYIYYNANIGGTMQIWRMRPDGSGKEQLTFDDYHNWYPHVSPDGKWIVFLSFPLDINPNEPPAFKEVTLRVMPLTAPGGPKVIAYLYGGQGTLNTLCWSPNSKRLAFVSNSEPAK